MRLFITALACLFAVSVFGQVQSRPAPTETDIRNHFVTNGAEGIEGIWEYNSPSGTSEYRLLIIKEGYKYKALILDTNKKAVWRKGATKATIEIAANGKTLTIRWKMGDGKTIKKCIGSLSDNELSIEFKLLNKKTFLYKVYPTLNDASTSEGNDVVLEPIRVNISESIIDISKVAVIGKESILCDGKKDDGQGLADLVEGELLGVYGVVERKHLEEILAEQRLAMSGLLLEDSDFANAGLLAGAQGTVLASYGCLQGKTKLQVKLVDCSTSDIYWSATGFGVSEFDLLDALKSELKQ